jgi:pSer/pThr/pTyr-binding forkhead associated (FHA) protein
MVFEVLSPVGQPKPAPVRQPVPLAPQPAGADVPRPTETTSRNLRDAMLLSTEAGEAAIPPGIRYSLAFLTGPQASTVRALASAVTVIGREEGDVIINDPEISRKHARIEIHADGTAWLADLGSTNGTASGGKVIDGPIQLFDRQEFSCGRSTFMLLIRAIDAMSME